MKAQSSSASMARSAVRAGGGVASDRCHHCRPSSIIPSPPNSRARNERLSFTTCRPAQILPRQPGHRPPSDIYPSIWRLNPQCRLYHTLSKPRWPREALQLPLVSSAAAPKLTSSQLLSSTRRSEAKIVSFFNSQSIACAHAHAESTAYRHQHDLPQMPSLKPSQWAVISARIRLGT